jgi:hypothetical protein
MRCLLRVSALGKTRASASLNLAEIRAALVRKARVLLPAGMQTVEQEGL